MAKITAIKPQKGGERVNIYLDGKFSFGIDLENFVKNKLKVEQELSQKEIKKLKNTADLHKNINKAINYAMLRPRSEYEISQWFYRKKIKDTDKTKILKKLNKLELIDDEKFATWWVGQRQTFRPRSKRALYQELMQKRIDKRLIDKALSQNEIDESKIAKDLYIKNKWRWEKYDERKAHQKASEFLARKGFNWDIIKNVIN